MLHYTKLERFDKNKHPNLFYPLISNKENEVLWKQYHFHNTIFFVTYEWVQWASVLHCTKLERFHKNKHANLFYTFISYE